MDTVKQVYTHLACNIPLLRPLNADKLVLTSKPEYQISVTAPDDFDNYQDVIAKVTVYHNHRIIYSVLTTRDTDYDKFVSKLCSVLKLS